MITARCMAANWPRPSDLPHQSSIRPCSIRSSSRVYRRFHAISLSISFSFCYWHTESVLQTGRPWLAQPAQFPASWPVRQPPNCIGSVLPRKRVPLGRLPKNRLYLSQRSMKWLAESSITLKMNLWLPLIAFRTLRATRSSPNLFSLSLSKSSQQPILCRTTSIKMKQLSLLSAITCKIFGK